MRLALALLLAASAVPAAAQAFTNAKSAAVDYAKSDSTPKKACDAMLKFKAKELVSIEATETAATATTPAYCRVTGIIAPEIAFEVSLPAKWNGRFYMIGNGGHAGQSIDDPASAGQRTGALALGFAFAQTNTGHDARKEPGASFVMSNPQKAIDYAYRAVHMTAVTAKDVIKDYYGKAPTKSYWNSCSNGGRQGLLEAQRYPGDFDGIYANAPWVDQTGFTVGAMWNQKALTEAPITAAKAGLVAAKVMEKCDTIDGLLDGVIDDPRKCNFDAKVDVPVCGPTDAATCLTPAQAATVMKIYNGPQSNGKPYFTGFMPGSEALGSNGLSGWMNMIVPAQPNARPADFNLAENTMRYLVFTPPQPEYDTMKFDYDRDIVLLDEWSKKADAKQTDLSAFRKGGGKLIMTYGWADTVLQPMMGVTYYEQAVAKNGPQTGDFFRLFMVPGMAHCGGGNGTDRFDAMTALIDWVEKNKAPEAMQASRVVNNLTVRTRPLCPYPQVAKYLGSGSIDNAASFECAKP